MPKPAAKARSEAKLQIVNRSDGCVVYEAEVKNPDAILRVGGRKIDFVRDKMLRNMDLHGYELREKS